MNAEWTQIEGCVTAVVFTNQENGYTVARMKTDQGGVVTIVGTLPQAVVGERLRVTGLWAEHSSYGRQLEIQAAERSLPDSRVGILAYLSSRAIRGIGPKLAARIVERFGAKTLEILEHDPQQLTRISGISAAKAEEIHQSFLAQQGLRLLVEFLTEHQLSADLAVRIYKVYGELSMMMIEEDPYCLVQEPIAAPFSQVDRFAIEMGFEGDDERRVDAGILFELRYNLAGGHVFLPCPALVDATAAFLHLDPDVIRAGVERLREAELIQVDPVAGLDAVYLPQFAAAERYLAMRFPAMADTQFPVPGDLDRILDRIEADRGIEYAALQREAIRAAAAEQLLLITGGPGTGKTTILEGVLDLFDRQKLKTLLTAPTGRAAKRLSELTGREASTIHRLLEVDMAGGDGEDMVFLHDEHNPLTCDALIVDETSMVDLPLMYALVRALPPRCRLILVGDPDQLPSVGPGNVFSDLIRSERIRTIRLTEIFRQARQSMIVLNAHRINRGELPDLNNTRAGDFFFMPRQSGTEVCQLISDLCRRRLPEKMGIPKEDIQVLSPTRKGETGTRELNRILQASMNPPAPDKAEKQYGDYTYRVGDRVMQIRNNYDIIWHRTGGEAAGAGIFNGDVGLITEIDAEGQTLTIRFDDREAVYSFDLLPQIEPAFAMTVHKSQGSEYRAVVLCAWRGTPLLLSRSVLYTAVTRARELLIVVGDREAVAYMVRNEKKQKRFSGLRWRLRRTAR